jgi:NADH-quinone oxidoreductase subunit N
MYQWSAGLAILVGAFFLSLAGIPPLAGWFAKVAMFSATIAVGDAWGYSIAVVAAVNTVVALVYYTKVVKTAFFDPVPDTIDVAALEGMDVAPPMQLALGITAVLVLVLGVFPGLVSTLAQYSSEVVTAVGL